MLTAEEDKIQQEHARELYVQKRIAGQNKANAVSSMASVSDGGAAVAGEMFKKTLYYIPVIGILIYVFGRTLCPNMIKKISITELIPLILAQLIITIKIFAIMALIVILAYVIANPVNVLIDGLKVLWDAIF